MCIYIYIYIYIHMYTRMILCVHTLRVPEPAAAREGAQHEPAPPRPWGVGRPEAAEGLISILVNMVVQGVISPQKGTLRKFDPGRSQWGNS